MKKAIDLSLLAAPNVVEPLSFEEIFAKMLADLKARDENFDALVESDPAYKVLEVSAYRELMLRQRVNDGARAVMLAYSPGADLDNLAAPFNVKRLEITPADDEAIPPVEAVMENDDALRRRCPLAMEGISTAGADGSYLFHALSADGEVKDAETSSPNPGEVLLCVLSNTGDGTASSELLELVTAAVSAENVRPLTDNVTVQSAIITEYQISASLSLKSGASADLVVDAAQAAVDAYVAAQHLIGSTVSLSGIYAALHQPAGVVRAVLTLPAADIVTDASHAPYCTQITINTE